MTSVACDICFEDFSEADRVPKVLGCGHTFCSVCLNKLLESQKMCPTCKTSITLSLEECATNFLVLKLTEVTKEKSIFYSSHASSTIKNFEKIFLIRKEMAAKSIRERTSLRNLITNNLKRLQQLEINQDILSPSLISDLEADVEKIDKVLYCCGKSDLKPTYSLTAYMSISFYLYELANRLHSREDIYAYEMVQNSKPKYGKITLNKGRIYVQALTVSNVSKGVALVSFSDLRKCITKDNCRTFIEIGSQKMSFIITGTSYLSLRFIKLCTGETGSTFKGVRCTLAEPEQANQRPPAQEPSVQRYSHIPQEPSVQQYTHIAQELSVQRYFPHQYENLQPHKQRFFEHMKPKFETDETYNSNTQITVKNKVQEEYIRIKNCMLNDVETEGFSDYNLDVFFDGNKITCSKGEVIVQILPNGSCEITKCVNDCSSYKNVVAKMENLPSAKVKLYGTKSAVIRDSGISLIF